MDGERAGTRREKPGRNQPLRLMERPNIRVTSATEGTLAGFRPRVAPRSEGGLKKHSPAQRDS